MKKILSFITACIILFSSGHAYANKTAVKLIVPDNAKKGSQVTITINVTHKGNTPGHFTDWVYLKINGKEVKRWKYDKKNLPSGGNFTLTYTFTLTENMLMLEAEGDCNIHGTNGPDKATVKVLQ